MSGSAVVVQAIANAIKSSGVVVEVEREGFLTILRQSEKPFPDQEIRLPHMPVAR